MAQVRLGKVDEGSPLNVQHCDIQQCTLDTSMDITYIGDAGRYTYLISLEFCSAAIGGTGQSVHDKVGGYSYVKTLVSINLSRSNHPKCVNWYHGLCCQLGLLLILTRALPGL